MLCFATVLRICVARCLRSCTSSTVTSATTPINSVLYVAEATSGKMAAYTLVWTSALRQKLLEPGAPGSTTNPAPITVLDGVQYRANVVRMPVSN